MKREHQIGVELLARRIVLDELLELGDQLAAAPGLQLRGDA